MFDATSDQETKLLQTVFNSALEELAASHHPALSSELRITAILAMITNLLSAADEGENDPQELKRRTLAGIDDLVAPAFG